jgi:hypothetical protein
MANKWPKHAGNLTTSKKEELCKKLALILCKYTAVARKMYNTKFANSQQAQVVYTSQNTKEKLLKNKAAIWFNNLCKNHQLTPKYIKHNR